MKILKNILNNRKGQGLSLTVIIVAALALVVLVVLIAIFLGRMGSFGEDVSKAGTGTLSTLQITYGSCHPGVSDETAFLNAYQMAEDTEDPAAKDQAYNELKLRIKECKKESQDEANCISFGCSWN